MPQIGETFKGNSFKMGFGGKGANKAIASSRLGSKCAVISKVILDIKNNSQYQLLQLTQISF
jgi:ribokinase